MVCLRTIPASWAAAGPSPDGAFNFFVAGPGLGTPDINGDREAQLDKIPDVTPLQAPGLSSLLGQTVCAVVYDSDISINFNPLTGNLKGANLGTVAFDVLSVTPLLGFSDSSLPQVGVRIIDPSVCEREVEPPVQLAVACQECDPLPDRKLFCVPSCEILDPDRFCLDRGCGFFDGCGPFPLPSECRP